MIIGLLKLPLSICRSSRREFGTRSGNSLIPWAPKQGYRQTLQTGIRLRLQHGLNGTKPVKGSDGSGPKTFVWIPPPSLSHGLDPAL